LKIRWVFALPLTIRLRRLSINRGATAIGEFGRLGRANVMRWGSGSHRLRPIRGYILRRHSAMIAMTLRTVSESSIGETDVISSIDMVLF
jgi:hypothetical protein